MDGTGEPRVLLVDGLCNARDLGGLQRVGGHRTPFGVFFRAENLAALTPAGWEQLRALGVRTVIDLRQPAERERASYRAPEWVTTSHVDHDGLDEHPDFWADYWDNGLVGTALYYLPHLQELSYRSAAVLSAIAQAPAGGVLFHCGAGRDRTGIIAMLLLTMAAVEPEDIVEDYMTSVRNGPALARVQGRADLEPACEQVCRRHGTTAEGAFRDVIADLDVGQVLDLLNARDRAALTTWRGALG